HYTVNVPSLQDTLRFSFIGYQTQTVAIGGKTAINISLTPTIFSGKQLVVVGFGTEKKENLTGAVSTIQTKSLDSRVLTNSTQALAGTKGLYIQETSAEPGAEGINIHIRGIGTLHNTNPLVLV